MEQPTMQQILSNTPRFSSRAEYFSGRGATLADLNYEILIHIQNEVKKYYGEDASKNFVNMIAAMENCNATDFINNCYQLSYNDFKWTEKKTKKVGHEIAKDEEGNYNMVSGMASIMSALSMGNRDQTEEIRGRFLRVNGIETRGRMRRDGMEYHY